jgi:hypothetical protein
MFVATRTIRLFGMSSARNVNRLWILILISSKKLVFGREPKLQTRIDSTFGSIDTHEAVICPPGEDLNEWLAVNTIDFFNQANVLYGHLIEHCTKESC